MALSKRSANSDYQNLIHFVPSSQTGPLCEEKEKKKHEQNIDRKLQGNEAKAFYESLLSESKSVPKSKSNKEVQEDSFNRRTNGSRDKKRKRRGMDGQSSTKTLKKPTHDELEKGFFKSTILQSNQRQHYKLLRSAELGHTEEVEQLLTSGLNVNFQDFYGWTPLMCAAKEGHSAVVKAILGSGAQKNIQNSSGDDACSIARNAGHLRLADLIISFQKQIKSEKFDTSLPLNTEERFFCEICKEHFIHKDQKSHFSSTVHLFNSGKRKSSPAFLISENNRGFQMLLRNGWTGDQGLGPEGKGAKYPVKTVLKQDRKGLGSEHREKKARISHFRANDEKAIESKYKAIRNLSVRTLARNAQKLKDKKERRFETNLRFELS